MCGSYQEMSCIRGTGGWRRSGDWQEVDLRGSVGVERTVLKIGPLEKIMVRHANRNVLSEASFRSGPFLTPHS
jgi:hypothetical protein